MDIVEVGAEDLAEIEIARELFRRYQEELDEDLCFQSFAEELESLPSKYLRPDGVLLLARFGDDVVGCVAIRRMSEHLCELKRLYVHPLHRRYGYGKELTLEALAYARTLGYKQVRLDTLARLIPALLLYRELGFREIEPYYPNPLNDVLFLELDLDRPAEHVDS